MWKDIVPALEKRHRVISIDLPGHGQSDSIGYVHTMQEMAEAVYEVLKQIGVRRVGMVGHSMGGYVALAFAEQFPDHVRSLVLLQSTALADTKQKKEDRLRAIELVKANYKSFVRKSIPLLFRPINRTRFKAQVSWVKEEALKTNPQGIIAAMEGMRLRPNRELLMKFPPYPVHIIAGEKDPRIPISESKYLSEISEFVRLRVIKDCGHMSYVENLEETVFHLKKAVL
jgi:pimeloyl-ACP methyl ester carboxylesterase